MLHAARAVRRGDRHHPVAAPTGPTAIRVVARGRVPGADARLRAQRAVGGVATATSRPASTSPLRARKSGRMQTMAETATETITIAAPLDQVWAIATDLERVPGVGPRRQGRRHHVTRRRRTARRGRVPRVGARPQHPLHARPTTTRRPPTCWPGRWSKATSSARSTAPTSSQPTPDGGTEVHYDLAIELVVPLPGFVKRRAEGRILNTVRELKTCAEA